MRRHTMSSPSALGEGDRPKDGGGVTMRCNPLDTNHRKTRYFRCKVHKRDTLSSTRRMQKPLTFQFRAKTRRREGRRSEPQRPNCKVHKLDTQMRKFWRLAARPTTHSLRRPRPLREPIHLQVRAEVAEIAESRPTDLPHRGSHSLACKVHKQDTLSRFCARPPGRAVASGRIGSDSWSCLPV
jgi:hypothetical protein